MPLAEESCERLRDRHAHREECEPDKQARPALAHEFAKFPRVQFCAIGKVVVDGFGDVRLHAGFLRWLAEVHHEPERRVNRVFLRPSDDEVLRVVIEIALVEWRRVHRVEELVNGLHLHLDQLRLPVSVHVRWYFKITFLARSEAKCGAACNGPAAWVVSQFGSQEAMKGRNDAYA